VNHLNPHLADTFWGVLKLKERIRVTSPLPRRPFIQLLRRASFVISDSAGVQEETDYLGIALVSLRAARDSGRSISYTNYFDAGNDPEAILRASDEGMRMATERKRPADLQRNPPPAAPAMADRLSQIWRQQA